MMGIRKKIMLGFGLLGFLLFFSGMVSMFELSRLSKTTQALLRGSNKTMEVSRKMLDAVQDQNTALLQMIVSHDAGYDSLFFKGQAQFEQALAEATVTIRDRANLDRIYAARKGYNMAIISVPVLYDEDWFLNVYKTSYYELTSAIKTYMTSSHSKLVARAAQLENNAYRAITPGIITLGAVILVIAMFFFFIDLYYIKPVLAITKGLNDYLTLKIPFNVRVEGKDEALKLRDLVETLIGQLKSK